MPPFSLTLPSSFEFTGKGKGCILLLFSEGLMAMLEGMLVFGAVLAAVMMMRRLR